MRLSRRTVAFLAAAFGLSACILIAGAILNIPNLGDRVYARFDRLISQWRGDTSEAALPTLAAPVSPPPTFVAFTTPTAQPTVAATPAIQPSNNPSEASTTQPPTPTLVPPTPLPIPDKFTLNGARYEPQLYNNCGPATLTAALVFWGWRGSETDELTWYASGKDVRWQRDIADVIKPARSDKNVMPYELTSFAAEYAGLNAVIRYGGDVDVIRRFVANGFPVIVERGFREEEHGQVGQGWEAHYGLITGYKDSAREFTLQDSFKGANYIKTYDSLLYDWRDFNYLYIILYPPSREAKVFALLGADADLGVNLNRALARAQFEAAALTDPLELAFTWYNIGASLELLDRNQEASLAFDQARSYNVLPRRTLWYQTSLYRAYFKVSRYQDVIDLANVTLQTPGLEESLYWRGWAYHELGNLDLAAADMRAALDAHPDWDQALQALAEWGISP
jgi:hypothetical protein